MSPTAMEGGQAGADGTVPGRLKLLLFLPSIEYYRILESLLVALLTAGHQVLLALDGDKGRAPADQAHPLDALREQHQGFAYRTLGPRKGLWLIPAAALRRRLDYLRYLDSEDPGRTEYPGPPPSWGIKALLFLPPFRWAWGRRLLAGLFRRLEAAMPISPSVRSFVSEEAPNVVVVSPLVEFGSAQGDYIRTAEAAGIPSAVVIDGEIDLAAKGGIRDLATVTIFGKKAQADAAVQLHHLPRERLEVVGAESSNGRHAAGVPGALDAIERAAAAQVDRRREGRILRPILWLLTPLLAILLPIMRPIQTAKAVRRLPARMSKRSKARQRERDEAAGRGKLNRAAETKEQKRAAKQERRAQAEAARKQKLARAQAKDRAGPEAGGGGEAPPKQAPASDEATDSEPSERQTTRG